MSIFWEIHTAVAAMTPFPGRAIEDVNSLLWTFRWMVSISTLSKESALSANLLVTAKFSGLTPKRVLSTWTVLGDSSSSTVAERAGLVPFPLDGLACPLAWSILMRHLLPFAAIPSWSSLAPPPPDDSRLLCKNEGADFVQNCPWQVLAKITMMVEYVKKATGPFRSECHVQ